MLIIYMIIAVIAMFTISYLVTSVICNARVERRNKAFANLPREVLLHYVLLSPVYSSCYRTARMTMSEDRAAEHAISFMLFNMGLAGYRKEGS